MQVPAEEDAEYSSCTPGIQHDFKNPLYSDSTSDQYGHGQWYIALTNPRLWHCSACKLCADVVNHLPLLCARAHTHTHTHTHAHTLGKDMDPYAYTSINASNEEYTYATVGQHVTADYISSTPP